MTITPEEIENLRELEKKASGPTWVAAVWLDILTAEGDYDYPNAENDAAFIAAARNILPRLLEAYEAEKAAREKAEADLADAEKALGWLNGGAELQLLMKYNNELMARADRLAKALGPLFAAALGLSFGKDWNNGAHALHHGYRQKLLDAIPAACAALAEEPKETGNG